MDEATIHAWKEFMVGPGGADLMKRLSENEVSYTAEGMKANTIDQKALAMAKLEAIYRLRSGIQDIVAPKPAKSQSSRLAGS